MATNLLTLGPESGQDTCSAIHDGSATKTICKRADTGVDVLRHMHAMNSNNKTFQQTAHEKSEQKGGSFDY
jgi:hypothetical protein